MNAKIEAEREARQKRLADIRKDRRLHGNSSLFSQGELIAAINRANADDDEIECELRLRELNSEWRELLAEWLALHPGDDTIFGDIGSLRDAINKAKS